MRRLLLLCLLLCLNLVAHAQDTILRTDGEELKARVLTITPTDIAYIPTTDPPRLDTVHVATAEVFLVRYANGTKEVLHSSTPVAPTVGLGRTPEEMNNLGRQDARKYFKAPGAFWGTFGATFVSAPIVAGLAGIVTGTVVASSAPKSQNIIVPDKALLTDSNYLRGYEQQAQRKKLGKAVAGYGVGLVTGAAVWIAVALANTNHF